ncbi:Type 2 glycosyltransferase like protein [Verticillium longisporum]|uniref:Type 2 glycosyltransferase like protein n=1 Tax=Verticillium longisporum TaxID=100787 RepID=A0A8I2ZF57_VERLO|nr:Type 2 glycosyltransferase like protein [Verticillium longisporum]
MFTTWTSLHTFIGLFLFRYTRLVVHIVAYFRHASVLPPISPSLRPIDITVVIATRGDEIANLVSGLESHVNAGCRHISICVPSTRLGRVQAEADLFISKQKDLKVYVSHVAQAGKREQLKWAIDSIPDSRRKAHKVIVFADDDITFPHSTYGWVLAPFENPQVGGVGTCQRASRIKAGTIIQRIINWIFADYIERRGVENMATVAIEKSISCLSGRLAAFRAVIVQDRQFLDGLVSETWNGLKLRADDDNFWTRWLLEGGWEIAVQNDERKFPWAIYALYLSGFVNYGLPMDIALWSLCWKATADSPSQDTLRLGFVSWWLFIKTVKRIRLFRRDVRDVLFLPVCILWGYCHDFIKLYALMTRYETGW